MKKTLKLIGIGFGCFNFGIISIVFPIFFLLSLIIFPNTSNDGFLYARFILNAALCAIVAAAVFIVYNIKRSKTDTSTSPYAWSAFAGYELGVIVILIITISLAVSDSSGLGVITGY